MIGSERRHERASSSRKHSARYAMKYPVHDSAALHKNPFANLTHANSTRCDSDDRTSTPLRVQTSSSSAKRAIEAASPASLMGSPLHARIGHTSAPPSTGTPGSPLAATVASPSAVAPEIAGDTSSPTPSDALSRTPPVRSNTVLLPTIANRHRMLVSPGVLRERVTRSERARTHTP